MISGGTHPPLLESGMNNWRELKMMLKALADVARLTIVYHLARQEHTTVTDLTDRLNISQPLVSWHLRRLKRAGLVETHRTGRLVYCSLNRERFQQCLHALGLLVDPSIQSVSLPSGTMLLEGDLDMEE